MQLPQAAGDEAVRAVMPGATIFKPGHLVGTEDRFYNNFAQLAKVPALPKPCSIPSCACHSAWVTKCSGVQRSGVTPMLHAPWEGRSCGH